MVYEIRAGQFGYKSAGQPVTSTGTFAILR